MTCSLSSHGPGLQSMLRENNFILPQSPNPIIVRPQFNLKTSILNNLSDRACFLVQVPENAFLSSGYCGIHCRLIILCYVRTQSLYPYNKCFFRALKKICKQNFHQGALINHNSFYGNFSRHIALKFEKVGPAFSSVNTRPSLLFIDIDNRIN